MESGAELATHVLEHLQPFGLDEARERLAQTEVLSEIEITRLLTEVDHVKNAIDEHGYVPHATKQDILVNKQSALNEMSMPFAVTRTAHKIEHEYNPEIARSQRIFRWLGRTAVGVAESGYDFHFSKPAKERVAVEVAEAIHAQETLQTGRMQFFISPRMSETDAPAFIAAAEHLHEEDSIRASYVISDSKGNDSYRVMESLLVRDVPLKAWVSMLADESNIFGKSIQVEDRKSAVSVMKTFTELELTEEQAPEGPVTLVVAVLPYIVDESTRQSVSEQLGGFRKDQELYSQQAEFFSEEWYSSTVELEQSLRDGLSTIPITRFINNISGEWDEAIQLRVENHKYEGSYVMTRELAAIIEKAKRNIIATKAGVLTGNDAVIKQVDVDTIESIKSAVIDPAAYQAAVAGGFDGNDRAIVRQDIEVGGGCAGGTCGLKKFDNEDPSAVTAAKELGISIGEAEGKVVYYDKSVCPECGGKGLFYNKDTADATCPKDTCGATVVGGKKYLKKSKKPERDTSFMKKLFKDQRATIKNQFDFAPPA